MASTPAPKTQFLDAYEREHQITMRVLRAYPPDQADLRPHPRLKTARELAWVFALERGLGTMVWNDELAKGPPAGEMPPPPTAWPEVLAAVDKAHRDFGSVIREAPDAMLQGTVKFFTGPKAMDDVTRLWFLWFMLHDQIHHRGQFSVYLRMAGGNVPSIYGPSGDEPWM
jgi:uncharacterized damage-inducible protein DinB